MNDERMSLGTAFLWFFGGVGLFVALLLFAVLGPGSKVTPPVTARQFFTAQQYSILYPAPGQPQFDAQNPNPALSIAPATNATPQQTAEVNKLKQWGLNDCVAADGTKDQATGFFSGSCFCENAPAVRAVFDSHWPVQPWNTYSTFVLSGVGFLLLGFLVFGDPPQRANLMSTTYFFALCYAYMTIALGPLSMALHVGLRNWGGWFDSMSLYVWFGFVAVYGVFRFIVALTRTSASDVPVWTRGLFGAAWLVAIVLPAALTAPGQSGSPEMFYCLWGGIALLAEFLIWLGNKVGFAAAPATTWSSSLPDIGGRVWFLMGGITFLLALIIWLLSFTRKPLCSPGGFQGHALFHALSGVAAGFLYKYYRHEGEAGSGNLGAGDLGDPTLRSSQFA